MGAQASFPVDMQKALQQLMDAQRTLTNLLAPGAATIQQASRGSFVPFSTHRLDMLTAGHSIYKPFRIGPHKSILYRGLVSVSGGVDVPQAYTDNDVAYYIAMDKDADISRWMVLQVGKSFEIDFPVDEAFIYIPNLNRNPTFAVFETSIVGYVRNYTQSGAGNAGRISNGTVIDPRAAVTVDQSGAVVSKKIVDPGSTARVVTLYNAGTKTAWLGGTWVNGVGGGPYEAQPNRGVPLLAGEKVAINNTSGISAATATGESTTITYTIES